MGGLVRTVGIADAVVRTFDRADRHRLEEDLFDTVSGICAANHIGFGGLDFICMSAVDQIEGRIIQSMVTAGSVGAVGRELMTIVSAPEHAFAYTWMRLRGEMGRRAMFVAWGYPSEMAGAEAASLLQMTASEPIYQRAHGLTPPVSWALLEHALGLPEAAPTSAIDGPDAICAMLLSSEAPAGPWVAVESCGWASDNYDLGLRPVASRTGLAHALERAVDGRGRTSALPLLSWAPTEALRGYVADQARTAVEGRAVAEISAGSVGAGLPATGAHPVIGVVQMAAAASWLCEPRADGEEVLCAGIFGAAGQNSFASLLRRVA